MFAKVRIPMLGMLMLAMLCCKSQPDQAKVLASFEDQTLTLQDLETFLMNHAEENRWAPPGKDHDQWLEEKLRRLALEKLLLASDGMKQQQADPQIQASQKLYRIQQLQHLLMKELMKEAQPSEADIQTKLGQMQFAMSPEPVLDFQHIFFRLDRGDAATIRETAREVHAQAVSGSDFPSLARKYSHSANASEGGMIRNVNPSNLDPKTQEVLAALEEGTISPIIESRTGLHIFRLIRRVEKKPPNESQRKKNATDALRRERIPALQTKLLADLQQRIPVNTEQEPWQIGEFQVDETMRKAFSQGANQHTDQVKASLVNLFLFAQEAIDRQLATPEFEKTMKRAMDLGMMQSLLTKGYEDLETLLPKDRIKPFYDAQPSLFAQPEKRAIQLIFIKQGPDSFSTQKRLEKLVNELRNGADFDETAKKLSVGPNAEKGGHLGLMTHQEFAQLGPQIEKDLPKLKLGEISDPIYCTDRILSQNRLLLRGGFAIIKITDIQPEKTRNFEEVVDLVRNAYVSQHRRELDAEITDGLLKDADFKILHLPEPEAFVK